MRHALSFILLLGLVPQLLFGAITQEEIDALNRSGGFGMKYQLGTLINEAEDAASAADTVNSAAIIDGTIVADDLATSAVTSTKILDATILTADIATGGVATVNILDATILKEDIADNVAERVLKVEVGFADLTTATEFNATGTVPDNAIVTNILFDVVTAFSDDANGGVALMEVGLGAAGTTDNVYDSAAYTSFTNAGIVNPTDSNSPGQAAVQYYKMTAASTLNVIWTKDASEVLDAGQMDVYIFYTQGD